jgi:hypothetical protein
VSRRLPATLALLATTALLAGCGGGGDGGGGATATTDDAAATKTFRTRSEQLCRDVRTTSAKAITDFQAGVEDAARDEDGSTLQQRALTFLDDLDRSYATFFEKVADTPPPRDTGAWRSGIEGTADEFTALIAKSRGAVEDANLGTPIGLQVLGQQLIGVAGSVQSLGRTSDAVFKRYGVRGCDGQDLAKALTQDTPAATTATGPSS